MGDRGKGLTNKYRVERVDGKPLKGGYCIVLEVGDPNTWPALMAWADTVEADGYHDLAADVRSEVRVAKEEAADQMTNRDMAVLLFAKLLDQTPVWVDSIMGQQVTVRAIERDGNGRFLVYDHDGNDRMAEEYLLTNPGRPEGGRGDVK